ncbi:MAG: LacI family DNA-binding transcriptional regulator [Burkholderiales bacterium]|nr:LacI family DNA-binding transcriptional regulator [Burkholderiales bacterium]MDE2566009.1 LacI family DNA-binding transcriptional regulator [Burkholderiales bacterium]
MKSAAPRSVRATGRATLADVARVAEVSPMTASRALRGEPTVDAALVQRVQAAAAKLGYLPDPAARALASRRSTHVAVLIPSLTNQLFVELLEAAQRTLRSAGLQTLIGITHYDPAEEEQLLREQLLHRPAGVLLTGLEQTRATRRLLAAEDTPCVTMMEMGSGPGTASVGFSQEAAAAAMTRHLLQRGRRRIAFVAAQLDPRTLQRLAGWRSALTEAGRFDARLEWREPAASSVGLGAQLFEQIVAASPAVDAVFFCNDDLAQGALLAALRLGVPVPGRIAVAGFNDLPESAHTVPPLSTVRTPRAAIGQRAAELLVARIRDPARAAQHQDLGFELMVRGSS